MGDRMGSRENKLSSLKKSKKNPGAPAGRTKRQQVNYYYYNIILKFKLQNSTES